MRHLNQYFKNAKTKIFLNISMHEQKIFSIHFGGIFNLIVADLNKNLL